MKSLAPVTFSLALLSPITTKAAGVESNGVVYQTFVTNPKKISLHWLNLAGKPFHQLSNLPRFLNEQPRQIERLMNAGIFVRREILSSLISWRASCPRFARE